MCHKSPKRPRRHDWRLKWFGKKFWSSDNSIFFKYFYLYLRIATIRTCLQFSVAICIQSAYFPLTLSEIDKCITVRGNRLQSSFYFSMPRKAPKKKEPSTADGVGEGAFNNVALQRNSTMLRETEVNSDTIQCLTIAIIFELIYT